jgi:hypothetical protein
VFVGEEEAEEEKETSLEVEISSNTAQEIIYPSISGYKGDSEKTLISVWVETENGKKKSSISKIYINKKNSEFDVKIPVFLDISEADDYTVVAEGLGERTEKDIYVSREDSSEESSQEEEKNSSETGSSEISSFYTRKKIFEENITLYINLNNPSNKILKVFSSIDSKEIFSPSEKNTINISIGSADEILTAEVLNQQRELLERRTLQLNLSVKGEDLKELNEEKNVSSENSSDTSYESGDNTSFAFVPQIKSNTSWASPDSAYLENDSLNPNKITGNAAFLETRNAIKRNALFFVLAIALGFLIFNRRARAFVLKKTKFFKGKPQTKSNELKGNKTESR